MSKKLIRWILLIILILVAIICFYIFSKNSIVEETPTPSIIPTAIPSITPTPTVIPTPTIHPATIYFVSPTGNDSDPGSIAQPWKTIQYAIDHALPGDTIFIRAGIYTENITIANSGTENSPITIRRYSSEEVEIDGGEKTAVHVSGMVRYWVIDGLTIRSSDRYTLRLGWWGESMTDHWIVRNNKIIGANYVMGSYHLWENNDIDGTGYKGTNGDAGISDAGDSHHNTYRNNIVHDFTNANARGIWTQGKTHDSLIEGNTVYNILAESGVGQCIDLDGAGQVEWRHVVRGNHVSTCSYAGIQVENAFDSIIENNFVTGGKAGIIVINYDGSYGCAVGGENNQYGDTNGDGNCQGDNTNNIIRQNLITTSGKWGWGYGGIMNWYAGGLKIWGNTISSATGAGNGGINFQGTLEQTGGGSIKGNIIFQGSGPAICATDLASFAEDSNNLVYRVDGGRTYAQGAGCDMGLFLVNYQQLSGKGQNSMDRNPQFVNQSAGDYGLSANSPAIDSGLNIESTTDILGNLRPFNNIFDIGAFEYSGNQ